MPSTSHRPPPPQNLLVQHSPHGSSARLYARTLSKGNVDFGLPDFCSALIWSGALCPDRFEPLSQTQPPLPPLSPVTVQVQCSIAQRRASCPVHDPYAHFYSPSHPTRRLLFSSSEDSFPSLPSCRRGPDQLFPILFFSLQPSKPSLRRPPTCLAVPFLPLSQPRIPLSRPTVANIYPRSCNSDGRFENFRITHYTVATDEAAEAHGRIRRPTRFLVRPMVSTPPPSLCQTPEATTHDTTQTNPHPSPSTFDSLPHTRAPTNNNSLNDEHSYDYNNTTSPHDEIVNAQQSDPAIPPPAMEEGHSPQEQVYAHQMPEMARSDSSSASSIDQSNSPQIVAPVPVRPRLPSRKSSGTIIVPRESAEAVEPTDVMIEPGDVRAMSPRRTSEDLEALGREARDELRR